MIKKFNIETPFIQLLLILILAIAVKSWNIDETDIGFDECFSLYNAQLPVSKIITLLAQGDNPPLWEIILHYWISIFGIEELNVRALSLIFNVGTIIPLYLIGERFIGKKAGVLVSLLYVFSSFSLFLTHEARVYSLIGFLGTWSVYFYLNIINGIDRTKSFILLTIVNVLILYGHYIAVWLIVVQSLIFMLHPVIRKKVTWSYLWHLLALFLFFLAFVPVIYSRLLDSGVKGTWIQKSKGIESLYFILVDFFNEPVVAVVFLLVLILGLYNSFKKRKLNINILVINLMVWIPLLVSFIISFKLGVFLNRYFYFTLPLLYLSLVNVLFQLKLQRRNYKILAYLTPILLLIFSFEISTENMIHSGNHKEIKLGIEEIKRINDLEETSIYFSPILFDKQFVYYYDKNIFSNYFKGYINPSVFRDTLETMNIYPITYSTEINLEENKKEIVYLDKGNENKSIVDFFKEIYRVKREEQIGDIMIFVFIK